MSDKTQEEKKAALKEHFDVLELSPRATLLEVKTAYLHLKKLYSSDALVLSPLLDEISDERREGILVQLEDAYRALKDHFTVKEQTQIKTARERVNRHNVPEFEVFTGNALKLTREVLGIELKEISLYSGIPIKHLQNIEMERFELLPPKGYIRVFLKKYAEFLSLDPQKVLEDYLKAYDKKGKKSR